VNSFSFSKKPVNVPLIKTENRTIQTPIPAPGTEKILEKLSNHEARSMQGTVPLVWDRAQGFNVFDPMGNKWIDFSSAIFIANIGHSNPRLIKSIQEVLDQNLLHLEVPWRLAISVNTSVSLPQKGENT
tara:strand:+ start:233 stop:619 length:387 start_codon:yes stop_codon:yes gene_type:complete